MDHDSSAVSTYIDILLFHLAENYSELEPVDIWSDRCAAQFSCFMFEHPLQNVSKIFNSNYNISWNFYGSRHGKGEVGIVYTFLSQKARNPDMLLDNAVQVYNHFSRFDLKIVDDAGRCHFYYVAKELLLVIREQQKKVSLKTVPSTRHQMLPGVNSVKFRDLSCCCPATPCVHMSNM